MKKIMKKRYIKPEILLDKVSTEDGVLNFFGGPSKVPNADHGYIGGDNNNLAKPSTTIKSKDLWSDDEADD